MVTGYCNCSFCLQAFVAVQFVCRLFWLFNLFSGYCDSSIYCRQLWMCNLRPGYGDSSIFFRLLWLFNFFVCYCDYPIFCGLLWLFIYFSGFYDCLVCFRLTIYFPSCFLRKLILLSNSDCVAIRFTSLEPPSVKKNLWLLHLLAGYCGFQICLQVIVAVQFVCRLLWLFNMWAG